MKSYCEIDKGCISSVFISGFLALLGLLGLLGLLAFLGLLAS